MSVLGYDAVKTVLSYMSADMRSLINQRVPSLRTADKVTPLTINKLVFKKNELTVDSSTYKVGIHREATSSLVQAKNQEGGLPYDIDEFGMQTRREEVYPGDVPMLYPYSEQVYDSEETMRHLKAQLESYECQMRGLKKNSKQYKKLQHLMELIEEDLVPLKCRVTGKPYPYRCMIQLTKDSAVLEQVQYSKSLGEAMKALTKGLLGKRTVNIKHMEIGGGQMILRLPENLKMNVTVLKIGRSLSMAFPGLAKVIQDLKVLECSTISVQDLDLPLLKTTGSLVISEVPVNWLPIMTRLENPKVFLKTETAGFNVNDYLGLVKNWIQNGKPAGTCFRFGIKSVKDVKEVMIAEFGKDLTVTMSNGLKINVGFEKDHSWIMNMEVV